MDDRFKFRVWNKIVNGFVPAIIREDGSFSVAENEFEFKYGDDWDYVFEEENNIVEQCTGLKDKNGTLIYEGDIIFENGIKHIIHWDEKESRFRAKILQNFEDRFIDCGIGFDWVCYKEVIGNIHENKELLND